MLKSVEDLGQKLVVESLAQCLQKRKVFYFKVCKNGTIRPLINTMAIPLVILIVTNVIVAIGGSANPHHGAVTVSLTVFLLAFVDATRKDMLGLWFRPFYLSFVFITCYFPV